MKSATAPAPEQLHRSAAEHLWGHYTKLSSTGDVPIIRTGEGCHVEDVDGNRYLDALSGLFCVQIGYSFGEEIGEAAARQLVELPYFSNWSHAHPRAVELAEKLSELAPASRDGSLDRAFFVQGGGDAVEAAWKMAKQHFSESGERRWKVVSRNLAWHGATAGAMAINGVASYRTPFEPLVPEVLRVSNTVGYRRPEGESEESFTRFLIDEMAETIDAAGPDTVAMVILEPVQNVGGSITPPAGYFQGVRELCDTHGILLCADEVITGFGRLGHWFASERYEIRPDLLTCAKGLTSGHAPMGAVLAGGRIAEPFFDSESSFLHGVTFGGHPLCAAIALKNLEIMERENINARVLEGEGLFRAKLETLRDIPIVGDIRGVGYFYAIELVTDQGSKAGFSEAQSKTVIGDFISKEFYARGLICRTDDRADPVISISPPLVAGEAEFDEIVSILRGVLEDAAEMLAPGAVASQGVGAE